MVRTGAIEYLYPTPDAERRLFFELALVAYTAYLELRAKPLGVLRGAVKERRRLERLELAG